MVTGAQPADLALLPDARLSASGGLQLTPGHLYGLAHTCGASRYTQGTSSSIMVICQLARHEVKCQKRSKTTMRVFMGRLMSVALTMVGPQLERMDPEGDRQTPTTMNMRVYTVRQLKAGLFQWSRRKTLSSRVHPPGYTLWVTTARCLRGTLLLPRALLLAVVTKGRLSQLHHR